MWGGVFNGKCCLCSEEENEIYTLLKYERWAKKIFE
jgi:hypothetical protein